MPQCVKLSPEAFKSVFYIVAPDSRLCLSCLYRLALLSNTLPQHASPTHLTLLMSNRPTVFPVFIKVSFSSSPTLLPSPTPSIFLTASSRHTPHGTSFFLRKMAVLGRIKWNDMKCVYCFYFRNDQNLSCQPPANSFSAFGFYSESRLYSFIQINM